MSESILKAGLDGSGYVDGARVITKANLDMIDSTSKANSAIQALEGRFGGIGSGAKYGFSAARSAIESLNSPLSGVKSMIEQVESRIIRIGATVLIFRALGSAIQAVSGFFASGLKNVEEYQNILISMTASLTQIAIMNNKDGSKSVPQMYAESARYAGVLAEKMREVDINSSANYDQIMAMLQVYTSTGRVLDVNNAKQMAGFTALSNAIPALTKGQDTTRQMTTEMRAFATGTLTAGSTIAKMVDSMAKADGVQGGLKELIKIGNASGRSVLEVAAKYLEGFTAAIPAIAQTITTAKTSFETAIGFAQRKIFAPVVSDLVMIIQGAIKEVGDGTNTIAGLVLSAWTSVKNTLFEVTTITSKAGKISEVLTIKPEVMEGIKSLGSMIMWVSSIVKDATLYIAAHLEILTKLGVAYLLREASVSATSLAMLSYNAIMGTTNAMEIEKIATNARLITSDLARNEGIAARNALAMQTQVNLAKEAEQSIANVSIMQAEIDKEQMLNSEKIAGVRAHALEAEANAQSAASRLASATSYYEENFAMNSHTALMAEAIEIEKVAAAEYTAAMLEKERAMASFNSKMAYSQELYAREVALNETLIASEIKLAQAKVAVIEVDNRAVIAAERYNAALLANGETTGFVSAAQMRKVQTDYALMAADAQLTAVTIAQTEAIAMDTAMKEANSLATKSLALAQTALSGAVSLLGGPIGVIAVGLYLGYQAWEKWGNAAEKAWKQAKGSKDQTDSIIKGLDDKLAAYKAQQNLGEETKKMMATGVPVAKSTELEGALVNTNTLSEYRKIQGEIAQTSWEIFDIETKLKAIREGSAANTWANANLQLNGEQKISDLKQQRIQQEKSLLDLGSKALEVSKTISTKAPSGMLVPTVPSGTVRSTTSDEKVVLNAYLGYLNTYYKNKVTMAKEAMSLEQLALDESYRTSKISQEEYLNSTYNNNQKMYDIELLELKAHLEQTSGLRKQFEVSHSKAASLADNIIKSNGSDPNVSFETISNAVGSALPTGGSDKTSKEQNSIAIKQQEDLVKAVANVIKMRQAELVIQQSISTTENKSALETLKNEYNSQKALESRIKTQQDLQIEVLKAKGLDVEAFTLSKQTDEYKRTVADKDKTNLEFAKQKLETTSILNLAEHEAAVKAVDDAKQVITNRAYMNNQQIMAIKLAKDLFDQETKSIERHTKSSEVTFKASQTGVDQKTGIVTDEYGNALAKEQARHDLVMGDYNAEWTALETQILSHLDNEALVTQEKAKQLAIIQKIKEETATSNQTVGAIEWKSQTDGMKMLADQASKTYPKITSFQVAAQLMSQKYAKETVKDAETGKDVEVLSNKGKMQAVGAFTSFASAAFSDLAATQDQTSRSGFETAKAFSLASAVMSTAAAIMNMLATVPGPAGWAMAAAAGVMGAVQIALIASTSFGGGGNVAAPSGSFGGSTGSTGSSGTGLGNLPKQVSSVQDSLTNASIDNLTKSTDNTAVAIGRLSKSMDSLTKLFESGGAGNALAINAPNKFQPTTESEASIVQGLFGYKSGTKFNPDSVIRNITSAVFGGDWQTTDAGISLGINSGRVSGMDYTTREKDGGWFGSDKKESIYVQDSDLQSYTTKMMAPYISELTTIARTLGSSLDISKFSASSTDISTAGRTTDEIAKDVQNWMLKTLQGMSLTIDGLSDAVGSFDDAYAIIKQLNDALVSTNDAFLLVGKTALQGSFDNAKWAVSLQNIFGGLDKFKTAMDDYFSAMYNDNEQTYAKALEAQRKITQGFNEINVVLGYGNSLTIPKTEDAFNDLRNSLDITTEAGAKTYASLTLLGPTFATLAKYSEDVRSANVDLLLQEIDLLGYTGSDQYFALLNEQRAIELKGMDSTTAAIKKRVWALQDEKTAEENLNKEATKVIDSAIAAANAIKSIQSGSLSVLSPKDQYDQSKLAFSQATPENAGQLGQDFLTASKAYNATGQAYQDDYANVMSKLQSIAGMDSTTPIQQQINLLTEMKDAMTAGNLEIVAKLSEGIVVTSSLFTDLKTYMTSMTMESINRQIDELIKTKDAILSGTDSSSLSSLSMITSINNQLAALGALKDTITSGSSITWNASITAANMQITVLEQIREAIINGNGITASSSGGFSQASSSINPVVSGSTTGTVLDPGNVNDLTGTGTPLDIIQPSPPPPPPPISDAVTLFIDDYFHGGSSVLGVGEYAYPSQMGIPNDSLSSMKVKDGYQAIIYKDDRFGGDAYTYGAGDYHNVPNDIASSIKVTKLYANGGVTNEASIFGEAGWEAAVPLPDGRSIPVTLNTKGSADNKGVEERLEKVIQKLDNMEKKLGTIEVKSRLAANQ